MCRERQFPERRMCVGPDSGGILMKQKIALYLFSGTGNTKYLTDRLSRILRTHDFEVTVFPLEKGFHELAGGCDHIIFAFPANSQAVSPFVWKFFKSLPKAEGTRADILLTLNESTYVIKPLSALLKKKGYIIQSVSEISMPNNMLMKPADEEDDWARLENACKELDLFADSIAAGTPYQHKAKEGSHFVSFLARKTGLTTMSMRKIFVLQVNHDLCTRCLVCVQGCPVGNIDMADYPVHVNKCEFCMRCAAYCPEKAISVRGKENVQVRKIPLRE